MNFSKILNWIFGIMAFVGFFLMIGAVEMGIYEPITAHMLEFVIGMILMIPGIVYLKILERSEVLHYSRCFKKSAVAKRVLILLTVAFSVGLVIGGISGYVLKTHINSRDKEITTEQILERDNTETLVCGAYDDRKDVSKW